MPLNTEFAFFYGPEARSVWETARGTFITWLQEQLNDPEGDAQSTLNTEIKVTPSQEKADAFSKTEDADGDGFPVVFVLRGRRSHDFWGKTLDSVFYEGRRYEITLPIDMAMNGAGADDDEEGDETLCDAVCDLIESNYEALWNIGLTEIEISADEAAQKAGVGRNPHLVSFACYVIPTWAP